MIVNVLREHKLKTNGEFVFPTDKGSPQHHANILHRGFEPAQIAAKVVDDKGRPKYGLHALRHFYASWCINRKEDGGVGPADQNGARAHGSQFDHRNRRSLLALVSEQRRRQRIKGGRKVLRGLNATQTRHTA
jgi:integrase